jgi:glucose-1-phosphate adenylyltransferase
VSSPAFAVILAGGQGCRLGGLTRQRCKPALPFGGRFRSIDFTLSNCVNSGLRRIGIATQFRSESLIPHVHRHWLSAIDPASPESIEIWQGDGNGQREYVGTADAVCKRTSTHRTACASIRTGFGGGPRLSDEYAIRS